MTDYRQIIKKAKHYKAIGQTRIVLHSNQGEKPWHLATDCRPGGSHRLDIATSVWFTGRDPKSGLTFEWAFDIEFCTANGKGFYEIDVEGCKKVLEMLPRKTAEKFRAYLLECSKAVLEKGREWQRMAEKQFADAATLALIAQSE